MFPLKLDYVISGRQYVGILQVAIKNMAISTIKCSQIPLVQSNLDKRIFEMMDFVRFSTSEKQSSSKRSFQTYPQITTQGMQLIF
jgi:hypothetical protein